MTARPKKYAGLGQDEVSTPPRLEGEAEPFDAPPVRPAGTPGPLPDPNSLAARVKRGDATHLHAIIDRELHKRLKHLSLDAERSVSELVEEALVQYLGAR